MKGKLEKDGESYFVRCVHCNHKNKSYEGATRVRCFWCSKWTDIV